MAQFSPHAPQIDTPCSLCYDLGSSLGESLVKSLCPLEMPWSVAGLAVTFRLPGILVWWSRDGVLQVHHHSQ